MSLKDLPVPYVIADVGSNWKTSNNESDNLIMAKRHIHDAAKIGVSAIKFQLFTDLELYGMAGPNRWTLPEEWLPDLAAEASKWGIDFMCTAFSPAGYSKVDPFVNLHKVASCEMKDLGILDRLVELKKPFLISTGGACEAEVHGVAIYLSDQDMTPKDFAFLECVAAYPARPSDYNLNCLRSRLSIAPYIGISDHTLSNVTALTAVGLGARVFEKHFQACNLPGISTPDQCVSIGSSELAEYVSEIKEAYSALGDGCKSPRPSEKDITLRHRRRLKVIAPIAKGEEMKFGVNFGSFRSIVEDIDAGPPDAADRFQGKKAKTGLFPGDPVSTSMVEE